MRFEKNIYGLVILLLLASVVSCVVTMQDAPEQLLLSVQTQQWLSGKKLYHDIFTVQPPVIFSIYALPTILTTHIGILEAYQYILLLGFLLLAYIIYLCHRIILFHPEFAQDKKRQWEYVLLLATVLITFQNPIYLFDREYLLFILTLPYVLRFMPGAARAQLPLSLRITVGILAAIGFAIKPYSILLFAGVTLFTLLEHRSFAVLRSIENGIIYLLTLFYIALIVLLTPDFIHIVLPMAFTTYSGASKKLDGMLFFAFAAFAFAIPFADFKPRHHSPYRKDIFYLMTVAFFLLLYALANNGWGYTWNLVASFAPIITGFLFWHYGYLKQHYAAQGLPFKEWVFGRRGCMIAFFYNIIFALINLYVASVVLFTPSATCMNSEFIKEMTLANSNHPVKSFGTISMDFGLWSYIARETGAGWDTRFNHLWMFPKFLNADKNFKEKNAWVLDYVSKALAEDLEYNHPEIVFVDDTDYFFTYNHYVDLVAYFSASPQFATAWSHYRYAGRIVKPYNATTSPHNGYYLYQRKD